MIGEKIENLNLDSELLKPMKEKLEHSIDVLTKNAILTKKDAEITLKINVIQQIFFIISICLSKTNLSLR